MENSHAGEACEISFDLARKAAGGGKGSDILLLIVADLKKDQSARGKAGGKIVENGAVKDHTVLSAVKGGRCHYLPKELFQYKPNARWAEAYEYLIDLLYEKS